MTGENDEDYIDASEKTKAYEARGQRKRPPRRRKPNTEKKVGEAMRSRNNPIDTAEEVEEEAEDAKTALDAEAEDIEDEIEKKGDKIKKEINSSVGESNLTGHEADHQDHRGSSQVGYDRMGRAKLLVLLGMIIHVVDYWYLSLDYNFLPLRMIMYILFALMSYISLEAGKGGLSKRRALRHYTVVVAGATFAFPVLLALLSQVVSETVLQEVRAAQVLVAWFPLYYLLVRGVDSAKQYAGLWDWTKDFINPVKLVKRFYVGLLVFAILNVGLSPTVANAADQADQQLPDAPRLDPWQGVQRIGGVFVGGAQNFYRETTSALVQSLNNTRNFVEDPLGKEYETDVDNNLLGVEVSMEPQGGERRVTRYEGEEYNLQVAVQYASQYELNEQATFVCELVNRKGTVVRQKTIREETLGGTATNSLFKTCTFGNLSVGKGSQTAYTARMRAIMPFRTEAATEYYFVSQDFARDPATRAEYRQQVSDKQADSADAITTNGPVKLKTSNDNIRLPILVSDSADKQFPYGFSLEATQGEIVNVTHVEIDIPEYFEVEEGPTCKYDEDGSIDPIQEPREGYKKVILDEYLTINQNNEPYAACNILYNNESFDNVIFSPDIIQPITFNVIADYDFELTAEKELIVEEPVIAQEGGNNNETTA